MTHPPNIAIRQYQNFEDKEFPGVFKQLLDRQDTVDRQMLNFIILLIFHFLVQSRYSVVTFTLASSCGYQELHLLDLEMDSSQIYKGLMTLACSK